MRVTRSKEVRSKEVITRSEFDALEWRNVTINTSQIKLLLYMTKHGEG